MPRSNEIIHWEEQGKTVIKEILLLKSADVSFGSCHIVMERRGKRMRQEAYFCTVKEMDELGKNNIPRQLISHTHLIYSSPATLAFTLREQKDLVSNVQVWRFRILLMLTAPPGCCGRNTPSLVRCAPISDRFYYLLMDETDIVTGRHLKKIPKAVAGNMRRT